MKRKMKKIISVILMGVMVFALCNTSVMADGEATLPTSIDAPEKVVLYDGGSKNSTIYAKTENSESVMDFYEALKELALYPSMTIQVDYKIDDGEWHYDSSWDTSAYGPPTIGFSGQYVSEGSVAYISSYNLDSGIVKELYDAGCLTATTDGSYTYYRFDSDNHQIQVKARYRVAYYDTNFQTHTMLSDWSNTATFGNGDKTVSTAPSSLGAPVISDLMIYGDDTYYGAPETCFEAEAPQSVIDAMMWSEQYDQALEDSEIKLVVETSLDPNFGAGSAIYQKTYYETSSLGRSFTYETLFYNLWQELPDTEEGAFYWDGQTVYMRAKYVNERTVSDSYSTIESPYSNVLSLQGPTIKKYDISVTHGSYGFDPEGYYSEDFSRTEGRDISSIYFAALEGCYVDTVEVNGTVVYDKDDTSTHSAIEMYSYYFYLLDDEGERAKATKDLDIVITYAGTPTAQYGITTECGAGGYLTTNVNYVSWEDNSLVVYHGTAPTISINPNAGYEIDTVTVDGVVNAEAKETGTYTFDPITDSTHSISVTFKRVAYEVSHYVYHGTITTDYEGYTYYNDYVKIGDDITFTFAPQQDSNGNFYEIEKVYIDNVLNETAKETGTYTFENVQAAHSIYVYYSEDPVITHDITATSGENGSISPEGVIHAREGSTKTFYFYPDEGYEVDKVFVDDVEITNLATKEYYNIANVTAEHTIHVTFKKLPVQYNINVLVSGSNPSVQTVNPAGVTPVWEGESFTVNYSPFAGYEVEKVVVDGTVVDKNGTYTIANVAANHTIEIFFKILSYNVTFVDYDGTVLKTETVEYGAQATPPADPVREHYVFTGWDTTYSNVTTNVTVKAMYDAAEYTIKFVGWDGTVLKTESVEYSMDATAPTPPAREGYEFSHWSVDYRNVSSNLTVTAVYNLKEYTVVFVDADDTVLSTQTVKHGNEATAPADPVKEGYTFIGWDDQGYGYVTKDMTIKAMYVEGTQTVYTVTASANGNSGTVSPAGVTKIVEDGSVTVHFYPDEYSKISKVVVDGAEVELCTSYTFENITANHTVDVYFVPTAVINVKEDSIQNGTVTGNYDLIDDQTVYVLDVTPDEGYELEGIYINGVKKELELIDGKYVIRDLSDDMDIEVKFKEISTGEDDSDTGNQDDEDQDSGNQDDDDQGAGNDNDSNSGTGDKNDASSEVTSPETGDSHHSVWVIVAAALVVSMLALKRQNRLAR